MKEVTDDFHNKKVAGALNASVMIMIPVNLKCAWTKKSCSMFSSMFEIITLWAQLFNILSNTQGIHKLFLFMFS